MFNMMDLQRNITLQTLSSQKRARTLVWAHYHLHDRLDLWKLPLEMHRAGPLPYMCTRLTNESCTKTGYGTRRELRAPLL